MRVLRVIYRLLSAFVLLLSLNSFATTIYVDANNLNPKWPYSSWGSAATSIQEAVDVATDGDSVFVTNGNYILTSEISVTKSIRIETVNGPSETILNGNGVCRGFNLGSNECVVSGFTVTNCNAGTSSAANNGGGFLCSDNTPIITNCVITANVGHDGGGTFGGSVYNCEIIGNETSWSGGGVDWAALKNCLVADNYAGFRGGGVAHADLLNCTVVDNEAGGDGNGLFRCSATNSIIYYNNGEDVYWESDPFYQSQVGYSCGSDFIHGGVGNITTVPQFVDVAGGDYRLSSSSPCIDVGLNSAAPGEPDLDGNPRIQNSVVDMGAYEYVDNGSDPASGLIAYYPLDGNAKDASGNGNDGSLQGPSYNANGVHGGCYSFDGIDDVINLDYMDSQLVGLTSFSFTAWIKPAASTAINNRAIFSTTTDGNANIEIYRRFDDMPDGTAESMVYSLKTSGVDGWPAVDFGNTPANQWSHMACVWDGQKVNVYIDGVKTTAEFDCTGSLVRQGTQQRAGIGGRIDEDGWMGDFYGLIDDVRIYGTALTPTQIETLYSGTANDTDLDGLPDDWKETHFGSKTGSKPGDDPDNDGYDNLTECQKGFDPNSFEIGPPTIDVSPGAGGVIVDIKWHTVTGRTYRVEWKDTVDGTWQQLVEVSGVGGYKKISHRNGDQKMGWYRIDMP